VHHPQIPVPPQHIAFRPPPVEKRGWVQTANTKTAMVHPPRPPGAGNPLIKRKRAREEEDEDEDAMDRGTASDTVAVHKRRVYAGGDAKAANLGKASSRSWKVRVCLTSLRRCLDWRVVSTCQVTPSCRVTPAAVRQLLSLSLSLCAPAPLPRRREYTRAGRRKRA
jgi:hypothetical protein